MPEQLQREFLFQEGGKRKGPEKVTIGSQNEMDSIPLRL